MSPLGAKILIVGIPLAISLAWFAFWVLRLTRAARRLKSQGTGLGGNPPGSSEPPPR
jgi:hypothetical protein